MLRGADLLYVDLLDLAGRSGTAPDGTVRIRSAYVEVLARRC